jgi:hypothetical protein
MRKGLTRVGAAALALSVLAAVTCKKKDEGGHHPQDAAGVCANPCNQILVIGADGAPSCSDANITLNVNEVAWRTASPTAKLQIVFDPPSPFPNLRCSGGMCFSGPTDPNALPVGTNSKSFGYTATMNSVDESPASQPSAGSAPGPETATPTPTPSPRTALGRIIIQR